MNTLIAAGHSTEVLPLEMFWIEEDDEYVRFIGLNGEEFACRDRSCAPPPIGSGGSKPARGAGQAMYDSTYKAARAANIKAGMSSKEATEAAKASAKQAMDDEIAGQRSGTTSKTGAPNLSEDQLDSLFPGRSDTHKTVNENGTLSIGGLNPDGSFAKFSPDTEARLVEAWKALGPSEQDYVNNLVAAGKLAIGVDLKTGEIVDPGLMERNLKSAMWYHTANADAKSISDATGIDMDHVVAATTVLSAGRKWSGTKSGNAETARALAEIAANPIDIEVSQAAIDLMRWKHDKSTKGPGKIGLTGLDRYKAGEKINSNDLDSASLVELMYASNATRGFKTFDEWAAQTTNAAGKIGAKSPKYPKEAKDPIYPYFTSKGTHQVKQAMALMRGELSAREAITGPKYSSFYSNIRHPDIDYSITNDVWQYRVQAGNLRMTTTTSPSQRAKLGVGDTVTGNIRELTLGKRAVSSAQDLFQKGVASVPDGLASGDAMFRDSTRMMRTALNQLKVDYPEAFGTMRGHEFQALVWLHFGGGTKKGESDRRWLDGLARMEEVGL